MVSVSRGARGRETVHPGAETAVSPREWIRDAPRAARSTDIVERRPGILVMRAVVV
jgi:hypothetical protein